MTTKIMIRLILVVVLFPLSLAIGNIGIETNNDVFLTLGVGGCICAFLVLRSCTTSTVAKKDTKSPDELR